MKYYIINRFLNYLSFAIFIFSITFISQEAVAGLVFDASNMVLRFGGSNASASENFGGSNASVPENTTFDNGYVQNSANRVKTNSNNSYPAYSENTQINESVPIFVKPAEIKVNSVAPEKRRVYFDENDEEEYMPVKKQPAIITNNDAVVKNNDVYSNYAPQNTAKPVVSNTDNYPSYVQQNTAKPVVSNTDNYPSYIQPNSAKTAVIPDQNKPQIITPIVNKNDNYTQTNSAKPAVIPDQNKPQIITPIVNNTEDLIFAKPKKYDDEVIVAKYGGIKIIPVPTRKPKQGYYCDYEVKPADNLSIIGKHFNVNPDEIAIAMNVNKTDKLEVGKLYRIPVLSYYVLDGDSIDTIAKKYNVKPVEIKNINIGVADIIRGNTILLPIIDKTKIDISSLQSVNKQEVISKPLFMWPTSGIVSLSSFKDSNVKNDGIIITTSIHNPVVAIANGVVAYVGDKIKSYGNMIIIKHDAGYISVYGYTEDVLVQKNDVVIVGQAIAKTSNSKLTNRPVLYFSLRKNKDILDPLKYLPDKR